MNTQCLSEIRQTLMFRRDIMKIASVSTLGLAKQIFKSPKVRPRLGVKLIFRLPSLRDSLFEWFSTQR